MQRGGSIYILTNKNKTTLYIGVTADLIRRIQEHRNKENKNSFCSKYNLMCLIYYEWFIDIEEAIAREKQLKKWKRSKKEWLIASMNPGWEDLWEKEVKYW
jgi:putative endonuclease